MSTPSTSTATGERSPPSRENPFRNPTECWSCQAWSKAKDSRSFLVGVRRFESGLQHLSYYIKKRPARSLNRVLCLKICIAHARPYRFSDAFRAVPRLSCGGPLPDPHLIIVRSDARERDRGTSPKLLETLARTAPSSDSSDPAYRMDIMSPATFPGPVPAKGVRMDLNPVSGTPRGSPGPCPPPSRRPDRRLPSEVRTDSRTACRSSERTTRRSGACVRRPS